MVLAFLRCSGVRAIVTLTVLIRVAVVLVELWRVLNLALFDG
jgi:hypothetical protein